MIARIASACFQLINAFTHQPSFITTALVALILGFGTSPAQAALAPLSGAVAVEVGDRHSCALTTGGGVKCWGYNFRGQLGDGTTTTRLTATDVTGLTNGVNAIAAGYDHTCALTTGGGVKCWGDNVRGQLGSGFTWSQQSVPVDVWDLTSGVIAIGAGSYHTCAVTTDGGVKCWGNNTVGQLGDGTTTTPYPSVPVDVNGLGAATAIAIAAGGGFTCALMDGGGVKCWGINDWGQMGNGTMGPPQLTPGDVPALNGSDEAKSAEAISAGNYHSCAVTSGGGLKCWGDNFFGQVGDGTTVRRLSPVDVTGLESGVEAVAASYSSTCAVMDGGAVKCWGHNWRGEVGDGTTTMRLTAVDVLGLGGAATGVSGGGEFFFCASIADGGVQCWGNRGAFLGTGTISGTYPNSPSDVMVDVLDSTPPVITPSITGTPGRNGWYVTPVTVSWSVVDDESAITAQSGCDATTLTIDTAGTAVTCTATSGGGTSSNTVTVKIDSIPPTINCHGTPDVLWPPNHKLVNIGVTVNVTDALSGPSGFMLVSATSNEPSAGLGDGDVPNDIQGWALGVADLGGQLRAERAGAGAGRVYTVSYRGEDVAGNAARCSTTVSVPHDHKK